MSRVAIITYNMVPQCESWGSCQRMYYLAEDLTYSGNYVITISCEKGIKKDFYEKKINFNQIFFPCNGRYYSKLSRASDETTTNRKGRFSKIRKHVFSCLSRILYNEPGPGKLAMAVNEWINENKYKVCRALEEHGIDNVIVSGPSFAMFSIGLFLKKKMPHINLVIDYRDPWNLWKKGSFLTLHREKKILTTADHVTVTNNNIKNELVTYFKIPKEKLLVLENGYRKEDWDSLKSCNINKELDFQGKCIFRYVGSISVLGNQDNSLRSVNQLFRAFARLAGEYNDVFLQIIGSNTVDADYIKSFHADNRIMVNPPVKNIDALSYESSATALILMHTILDDSGKYLVSGKFYDYLYAGKPILSISARNGLHADLIDKYKMGLNSKNDEDDIYRGLKQIYIEWKADNLEKYKYKGDIEKFSREYQNNKILTILK